MSFDWKLMLKEQQDDLSRMERLDAAMNQDQQELDDDITSILRKPAGANLHSYQRDRDDLSSEDKDVKTSRPHPSSRPRPSSASSNRQSSASTSRLHRDYQNSRDIDLGLGDTDDFGPSSPIETSHSSHDLSQGSPDKGGHKGAPDTNARIQKARLKGLTQQLEDSKGLRKQLQEQVADLQKQLKGERDESKLLKKRITLLEADQRRRSSTPRGSKGAGRGEQEAKSEVSELQSEVAQLKRELQAAQRLVKQAEAQNKTKDTHLKRATETINRNKAMIDDFAAQLKGTDSGDKAKLEEALARVRMLEKHREELVGGFKKQMKLIDVLKRQKTHMEAARLLQFTEEEFVKTLDWAV